jgi:hypothetical protein
MSDASTRYFMQRYTDEAPAPRYFTAQFPNQIFFNTEEVELDIERETEDVAIVIQDLTTGTRKNEAGKFTNKSFKPPIYNEEFGITSFDLIKRQAGDNPFENPDFAAHAVKKSLDGARKLQNKVARAVELQAAQVMTTGELILTDDAGVALFSLDFQPKSSHFTTPTAWAADGLTGDPLGNIGALAQVIRRDGRKNPKRVSFGAGAWGRFMANAAVKLQLNSIGHQQLIGLQKPSLNVDEGATFMGFFTSGTYVFEAWVYDATYKHPQTGATTPYLPDNKVVLSSPGADMRLLYGAIPRLVPPDPRVEQFIPSFLRGPGFGLSNYAWITPDGTHVKLSVGSRPLVLPAALDTFGCITAY